MPWCRSCERAVGAFICDVCNGSLVWEWMFALLVEDVVARERSSEETEETAETSEHLIPVLIHGRHAETFLGMKACDLRDCYPEREKLSNLIMSLLDSQVDMIIYSYEPESLKTCPDTNPNHIRRWALIDTIHIPSSTMTT